MLKNKKFADQKIQLIIAGNRGWRFQNVFKVIKGANKELKDKYGEDKLIKYLGYVSNDDKLALLQNSSCFAFPSLYEGFGLPVLEAMSFGIPVLTSNVSSLPEVCGDAAVLVNPDKINEIKEGLNKILTDTNLREQLSNKAQKRAEEFSWQKTAKKTLEVYKSFA